MGAIFGKSKKTVSRVTQHDKAVLVSFFFLSFFLNNAVFFHCQNEWFGIFFKQLKQQRDKLKQYQKRIELSLVKDRELAKKCLATGRKE